MKELAEIRLRDLPADLVDLDVVPGGSFVAIAAVVERQMIRAEGRDVGEHISYHDQRLLFGTTVASEFPGERPWGMIVRALSDDTAIVVEPRGGSDQPNAWILNRAGQLLASFFAGDGIQDVVVCAGHIAITYFDEGIFGSSPEGVSIFNMNGRFEFGYHSQFGYEEASIADCYAACADERDRLLIFPYTDFPIVRIDVANRTREVFATPETVNGASALTSEGDRVFLWSPYGRKNEILELRLGGSNVSSICSYPGPLRGLQGGKFLASGSSGYTIISMID